jgi:hypothetical protein
MAYRGVAEKIQGIGLERGGTGGQPGRDLGKKHRGVDRERNPQRQAGLFRAVRSEAQ